MQNPRIHSFFSVFTQSVQEEIMDFCKRITVSQADVYIFMARKAAAFCDCLEELGLIHLDGYVTTDRVLDINGSWLSDKKIVIVDDAVVSGTTLYKTIKKLEQNGTKEISVQILTINERWFNPELLQDDEGKSYIYPVFNKLPDNLCIKLCNDIVQAISLVPRPYDVDFPLYKSITIPEYELKRILVLNNWEAYDISTDLQKTHNIINYTLIPNSTELKEISNIFNIDVTTNCIVKLRIYGRRSNKAKGLCSIRISPLVVFEEMDIDLVKQLFNSLVRTQEKTMFSNWNCSSQLRLLQFYYSNLLAKFWLYRIRHLISTTLELHFSYRNLSFLFPEKYITTIENLCEQFIKNDVVKNLDCSKQNEYTPKSFYTTTDPISINARLYEPFINMYHDKELPCRKLVLEKGKKVFENPEYRKLRNRLDEGISFQNMVSRLCDCCNDYDIEKKVSIFIDYSIDAGIIVPIIQQSEKTIYRAYRHGEDVLFGRREEMMYIKMLSLYSQYSGSDNGISRLSAEKLIVLFSKIGLKKKILHPYTSNFASEPLDSHGQAMRILRVKPYLKGPVALLGTALQHQKNKSIPFITNERKGLWLTNILVQNCCLLPNSEQQKYLVEDSSVETDLSLLTDNELEFVQNFAELTGRISNPREITGNNFSDNDWAKISVTLTLPDTITAVAAEMEIFYNDFDITDYILLTKNKEKDKDAIKHYINSFAFESVHNAVMKTESFTGKKGQKLINSISFPSSIEQRVWLGYFSDELNNTQDNNENLSTVFYEQKVWVYLLEIISDYILIIFMKRYENYYNDGSCNQETYKKAINRLEKASKIMNELKNCIPTNAGDAKKLFAIYNSLIPLDFSLEVTKTEVPNILINLLKIVKETEIVADNIKEAVCGMLGERGKVNEIIRYNFAFHINLDSCPKDQLSIAYSIIESAYKKELQTIEKNRQYLISKGKPVALMRIDELPQKYKPEPNSGKCSPGIWYIAHGPNAESQITSFAMNVFYKLYVNNIDCQVSIFDSLRYDCCIKCSSAEYAEYHCNQFNTFMELFKDDVLFPIETSGPRFIHICPKHLEKSSKARERLQQTTLYQQSHTFEKNDQSITKDTYNITSYKCTESRKIVMNLSKKYDFGIITILPEELDAVKRIFNMQKLPSKFQERIFYSTTINSTEDNALKSVVCTQTIDQGELSVINAYNDMVQKFHPKILFLVGIAGGILNNSKNADTERLELDLCDVVIAKSVIDYEMRKESKEGVQHRGRSFDINVSAAAVINDFISSLQDSPISSVRGGKNDTINILFDAIGSGNAVIAHDLSSIKLWLQSYNSKVAAVEMEATGISSAFYESVLSSQNTQGVIIVRGISDLADVDKALCKKFRSPAAQNAAMVTRKIMEIFPQF